MRRISLAIVTGILVLGLAGCAGQGEETATPEVALDFVPVVSVTGEVVPARWATIGARANGRATEVLVEPGDEVVLIEPAYDSYAPCVAMAGGTVRYAPLTVPGFRLTAEALDGAVTQRTKLIVVNTPMNPTGRVFDEEEMAAVTDVVVKHDLVLITDEIYDRILYDGRQHVFPGSLEELKERTITVGGLGKTFAVTGWRLGYVVAPTQLSAAVRPVHDFLTVCAPTPLQHAAVAALNLPQSYYDQMTADYHRRREVMMSILDEIGFAAPAPEGAYYVLADYSAVPIPQAELDSMQFAVWMVKEVGVAVVPGIVFYSQEGRGDRSVRFAFPKKIATLQAAGEKMRRMLKT